MSVFSWAVTDERKLSMPRKGASALSMFDSISCCTDCTTPSERLAAPPLSSPEARSWPVESRIVTSSTSRPGTEEATRWRIDAAALRPVSVEARTMTEAVGFWSPRRKLPTSGMTM
ncbi:hypothetical protein D3C72_1789630 [compost metagenome]